MMREDGAACLHEVFRRRAEQDPGRTAVVAPDGRLTYGELAERAGRVAARLREAGIGPDMTVGLAARRGTGLIAGLLGILEAGAAYLSLDPDYPAARLRYLLEDSKVAVVVADDAAALPGDAPVQVVPLDSETAPGPAPADALGCDGDRLAYVIYTSGSTGAPKGVQVEHHSVLRLFEQTRSWFGYGPDDVWTMVHSASFDFSVWELWGALLHGGTLVVVPTEATRSPQLFRELLARERVSVLSATPSMFRQLMADATELPPSLRCVVFGGERLDPALLRPWIERFGDARPELVNMYGITETCVHVTYRRMRRADLDRPGASPIGVPIPDLRVHVLDGDGRPVADGIAGELYVGGPGVARGYLDRPELTAERFVTLSVDGAAPERLYRSGDLVVREDGELYYAGRADDQFKVRGFRVEPGEIEACLAADPRVGAVAVLPHDFGDGDLRLVAHVVPAAGAGVDPLDGALAARARAELPVHLRPAEYRVLDRLPLTPSGKTDRAALAAYDPRAAAAAPAAPDGDVLAVVGSLAGAVLGRERVNPDSDLFDIGATSLAFIRIIAEVNRRFGTELNGSELGVATLRRIATCVKEQS
ncbi:amino acid adenylation domain-containing protein [Dactylosporangium sp. NPDC000244]|uniref:amino acid adenylation domain-containing protein n=1 Tax=Dactylosporangium sp. NPDC000244 TaxID=3154365 RepID=UPI00331E3043